MMGNNSNAIKVAVAGVGNMISGLIQGLYYYKDKPNDKPILHPKVGGFQINAIHIVAAFDVSKEKVGKDVTEAIFAAPNKTPTTMDIPPLGVKVHKVPVLDGVAETAEMVIKPSNEKDCDLVKVLKESDTDVLVIAVPSGSVKAAEYFAQAALDANVALINASPAPLARNTVWSRKFREARLPLLGDDLQSQAGGTVFHKGLINLLFQIGVRVKDTYQLDVSGGLEGLTTLDYDRRQFKRKVKEESISRSTNELFNIASGTTDYLDFLGSTRIGNYWVKGEGFLGQPVTMDIRMESIDSSNGAATLIDAIRCAKIALNRVIGGPVTSVAPYLFKAPPMYMEHEDAFKAFLDFSSGKRMD